MIIKDRKERKMKPVRSNELQHLERTVERKFDDRESEIKSENENEIQSLSDKNLERFKKRLNIKAKAQAVVNAKKELDDFVNSKERIEQKLQLKLDSVVKTFFEQMETWNRVRRWKYDFGSKEDKDPSTFDNMFSTLCKQETEKAFYNSPKGQALKVLNKQKERAQNIIYSGDSIQNVWRYLGQVFNQAKINAEIPKQMLQLPKE